jgi:FixJ family two-component response regulator
VFKTRLICTRCCKLKAFPMMQRSGYVAIVDDDASMRQALGRLLRIQGINSRIYPSARAFLEALPSGMPDCLIVDVNMPEMTGIELQRELLNRGVSIPTIVISANDDESIAASARSLGAAAFFVKPVPRPALMATINSAEKRQHMHAPDDFDHSGTVIDWLNACRSGQLDALVNLHDVQATLRCDCDGVDLAGRNSLAIYWKSKFQSKAASAFTLNDMILTGDEIQLDCQSCKGKPVRVHFRFNTSGKILHTRFVPLTHSV